MNIQITALAREYAEEYAKGFAPADMPCCLKNEATGILVCNAEDMLKWLLRRFCLVEKEAVRREYSIVKSAYDNPEDETQRSLAESLLGLIYCIFPDIAKEVEL